ncbi:hypothetical protein ACSA002_2710 [Salmonella phage vB_SalM_SA002]|nr:hypothetical protein ACSA002_2710 [Salmonella phage vB_SalM_SA002]
MNNQFGQQPYFAGAAYQSIADKIVGIVNDANDLIKEVTSDYSIDPTTGALAGLRAIPSLTGNHSYEPAIIGYIAIDDHEEFARAYFSNEPAVSQALYSRSLSFVNKEELKASIEDAKTPIAQYSPITLLSSFDGLYLDALVVVLEERGFLCRVTTTIIDKPNEWPGANYGRRHITPNLTAPVDIRGARDEFINKWTAAFKAPNSYQAQAQHLSSLASDVHVGDQPTAQEETGPAA